MKKIPLLFLTVILCLLSVVSAYSSTIITSPVDGRPVSMDYLERLAELNGDTFITVSKENLDCFTQTGSGNHLADSAAVREEIAKYVSENNTSDTTVIINTSSYITGGLVGSRIGDNYSSLDTALSDLYTLVSQNKEPTYYVNIAMPRTLPETRLNSVWRDNKKAKGLSWYYIKYNENSPNKAYINSNLARVNPSQLILEYVYLINKQKELGKGNLTLWENEFLEEFDKNYKSYEPYKSYIENYIVPYRSSSVIYKKLSQWQKQGLIDEIVIGVDDFQLPDSIIYLNANEPNDWIICEDGSNSPVKYSYAGTYLTRGEGSIYKQLISDRGKYSALDSYNAEGENINFIFGTDEIPQLIYARDVSKRANLTTDIQIYTSGATDDISKYDLLGTNHLLKNAVSFVTCSKKKTKTEFDLYLYNYSDLPAASYTKAYDKLNSFHKAGNDVGLIEIFNGSPNYLFQKLLNTKDGNNISLSDLSSYSAWNTSANAIGLGVAHTQVYGIAKTKIENEEKFIQTQVNILGTHFIEDGIYTHSIKKSLSATGYIPTADNSLKNETLYNAINPQPVLDNLNTSVYKINENTYTVNNCTLTEYYFPWTRLFDCYLNITAEVTPAQ